MNEGDDKLSERYRALPREEPPAALDAAILASARRAVAPRRVSQRWAVPVSLAAVLVLAVGVTLRMQQEKPGIETSAPANEYSVPAPAAEAIPPPAPEAKKDAAQPLPQAREPEADKVAPVEKRAAARAQRADTSRPEAPAAPQPAPQALPDANVAVPLKAERLETQVAPAAPAAPAAADRVAPPAPAARASTVAPAAAPAPQTLQRAQPEAAASGLAKEKAAVDSRAKELERIAQLRQEGRHAEADEALQKFRRENPDYRIPEEVWERVKSR